MKTFPVVKHVKGIDLDLLLRCINMVNHAIPLG